MRYAWFVAGAALCACLSALSADVPKCEMPPACKDGCVVIPLDEAVRINQIIEDRRRTHRT
jgi:hypothetical protein